MRTRRDREEPMREARTENVLELQPLGLVHGHDLDRVPACARGFGVVRRRSEHRSDWPRQIRQQRLPSVEPFEHIFDALETFDRGAQV